MPKKENKLSDSAEFAKFTNHTEYAIVMNVKNAFVHLIITALGWIIVLEKKIEIFSGFIC